MELAHDLFTGHNNGMPDFKIFHTEGVKNFGHVSKALRTKEQEHLNEDLINAMPNFKIFGSSSGPTPKKVCLWDFKRQVNGGKDFWRFYQKKGSCFPAGVLVRMADGSEKEIQNIDIGDKVITHNGLTKTVTDTFSRSFDKEMITITLKSYPFPLEMTEDHEVPVNVDGKIDNVIWVKAKDLKENDQLIIAYPKTNNDLKHIYVDQISNMFIKDVNDNSKVRVKYAKYDASINNKIVLDEDFAKFIGLYLAEGGSEDTRVTFTFNRKEDTLVNFVAEYGEKIFNKKPEIIKSLIRTSVTKVRFNSVNIANFLKSFVKGNVYTKQVPNIFFNTSETIKLSLIKGWLDGGGYWSIKDNNKFTISGVSVSKKLIKGMYVIAASCGLLPSITIRKPHKQSKTAYSLYIAGKKALDLIPELKDAANALDIVGLDNSYSHMDFGFAKKIKKIERNKVEQTTVYDIEVEETHSFIANNIAVHNCVGNGFGQVLWTLQAIESVKGDGEEVKLPFWLLTYGLSRSIGGMHDYGEGSFGSAMAEAARIGGTHHAYVEGVPQPQLEDNDTSVTWGGQAEWDWSNGDRIPKKYLDLAKQHLIKTTSLCKTADDVREALINGYPCTCASDWGGNMRPAVAGRTEPVILNRRTDTWQHQMSVDAWWEHPDLGEIFYIANSWGTQAHGKCPSGAPLGGFWILKADMNYICRQNEVFAYSQYPGYPAQNLDDMLFKIFHK